MPAGWFRSVKPAGSPSPDAATEAQWYADQHPGTSTELWLFQRWDCYGDPNYGVNALKILTRILASLPTPGGADTRFPLHRFIITPD